jgi:hypothetical protein
LVLPGSLDQLVLHRRQFGGHGRVRQGIEPHHQFDRVRLINGAGQAQGERCAHRDARVAGDHQPTGHPDLLDVSERQPPDPGETAPFDSALEHAPADPEPGAVFLPHAEYEEPCERHQERVHDRDALPNIARQPFLLRGRGNGECHPDGDSEHQQGAETEEVQERRSDSFLMHGPAEFGIAFLRHASGTHESDSFEMDSASWCTATSSSPNRVRSRPASCPDADGQSAE